MATNETKKMDHNQTVSVGGVLIHEDKVLVVKKDDKYVLPQGQVDYGEHPQESVTKHFLEITGLLVEAFVPFRTSSKIDHQGTHIVEILYLVDLIDTDDTIVTLSDAYEESVWVSDGDIAEYVSEEDEETAVAVKIAFELYQDWNKQLN